MYLISDKKFVNGDEIKKNEISNNVFSRIAFRNFYCETLTESQTSISTVSITGDVSCDLLEGFDYTLTLYDFVYEVVECGENYLVKKMLDESEYMRLFVDALVQDNDKNGRIYAITELLNKKNIREDKDYSYLLENIKKIIVNMGKYEYGFIYLLKILDEKIPSTYSEKLDYMEYLSKYLIKKIKQLGLITEEDKVFIRSFLDKYHKEQIDESLLDSIEITDLPF